MVEAPQHELGLLDTSVVIELDELQPHQLPRAAAVSAITMAELAVGPHAASDAVERGLRQDRLQRAEVVFDPLPFDTEAARAYGRLAAVVVSAGHKPRGPRAVDLLIAATAVANRLPLYTCNEADLRGLEAIVEIVPVRVGR